MAATIPGILAAINVSTATNACAAWSALPPKPTTAAQRATAITALLAGTVTTEASALALIATAASGISEKQVWDIMTTNPPTLG